MARDRPERVPARRSDPRFDVGAKPEIYRLIRAFADDGRTVLVRSTELSEVVGLADRILIMRRGRLAVEMAGGETDDLGLLTAINTGRRPGSEPVQQASPEEVAP